MNADNRRRRVLRVAVIEPGTPLRERLIPPGEALTIGTERDNTFVVGANPATGTTFELFRPGPDGTTLRFTDAFGPGSKLATHDTTARLRELVDTPPTDGVHAVLLTPADRGKLVLGPVTVLFQFVAAPVAPARLVPRPLDFRPALIEPEDAAYLASLAVMSALAMLLSLVVWTAEAPEYTIDDLPAHVARFHLTLPPSKPVEPLAKLVIPQTIVDRADRTPVPAPAPEPTNERVAPRTPGEVAAAREQARQDLMARSPILQIGTTGDGELTANVWRGSDAGVADLDGLAMAPTAGGSDGLRDAGTDAPSAASIGALGALGVGGAAEIGGGPRVEAALEVPQGELALADPTGGDAIQRTVRRRAGQMKYCYEQALKRVGTFGGRVELGWTLEDGRVVAPYVASNGTGNAELASCMVGKLSRWTFDEDLEGDVHWPFVFSAK
jgi:hypothetical protein